MMTRRHIVRLGKATPVLALALCLGARAVSQAANATGAAPDPGARPSVALSSGTCPNVADGDVLTLDWNPAFDHAGGVLGLGRFELFFARKADRQRLDRNGPPFHLTADPRSHGQLPGRQDEIEADANGFYHLRFHVHLDNLPTGEYELVQARATPKIDPQYHGTAPEMTNRPNSLPFCLNVTAAAPRGRG